MVDSKKTIENELREGLLSEKAKNSQFKIFEYANYSGIALGFFGATIIEIILLFFQKDTNFIPQLIALSGVGIISFITYLVIRYLAKREIGAMNEIEVLIFFPNIIKNNEYKNYLEICKEIENEEFIKAIDSDYILYDKEWSKKEQAGNIYFKPRKSLKSFFNNNWITITVSNNKINLNYPPTQEGEEFKKSIIKFTQENLSNR